MTTQKAVNPTAESLAQAAQAAQAKGLPPVHDWNPPFCGDLDMRIARDGDAPFVAVDFTATGEGMSQDITFTTNVGDDATASADCPLRVERDPATGEPSPYVRIRDNLDALIDRKSFYRLVDLGENTEIDGVDWFGVRSAGSFFPIIPVAELS